MIRYGWIASDNRNVWSFGYVSLHSPEPLLQIQRSTAPLTDLRPVHFESGVDGLPEHARFIGVKITALRTGNGWFRLVEGDDFFGQRRSKLVFEASKPILGRADYFVELFYVIVGTEVVHF